MQKKKAICRLALLDFVYRQRKTESEIKLSYLKYGATLPTLAVLAELQQGIASSFTIGQLQEVSYACKVGTSKALSRGPTTQQPKKTQVLNFLAIHPEKKRQLKSHVSQAYNQEEKVIQAQWSLNFRRKPGLMNPDYKFSGRG